MNDYNDRPADEPDPAAEDRPVAGFGWSGHNPDRDTDEQAGEHTDDHTGEPSDEETAGEEEPLVGEVWSKDASAETDGEHAGSEAGTAWPGEHGQGAESTDLAGEERPDGATAHGHVGEPFGTEEPMIVTEPADDETAGETAEDTTESEAAEADPAVETPEATEVEPGAETPEVAEAEPVAETPETGETDTPDTEPVAETPESAEPVAIAEPVDGAESAAPDAEPEAEADAVPVADGARPTTAGEFAIDYLVAPEAAERFRNRWRDVKGTFVDDPSDAVRQASALSAEAVEELTAALDRLRQDLEAHWGEGKDTDTERLRVALRGYGAFIDRILTR